MNPLTNVKNVNKMNQRELELGIAGTSTSWHAQYKDSAWIFVGGLPYDLSEGDVLCVFSQYGEIVNINMVRDPKTGKTRGFCFICYQDQRSTILAVDNLNGIKILSRTIRVDHVNDYKPPKEQEDEDEMTRKMRNEGCAPKLQESEPEEEEQEELLPVKKHKKEKKKKKERKKKKKSKKKKEESSDSDSSCAEEERDTSRHKQSPVVKVKEERIDDRYERNARPGTSHNTRDSEPASYPPNRGKSYNSRGESHSPDERNSQRKRNFDGELVVKKEKDDEKYGGSKSGRDRHNDRDRESDQYRERDRERDRSRNADRDRSRDQQRGRNNDRDRYRDPYNSKRDRYNRNEDRHGSRRDGSRERQRDNK